MPVNAQAVDTKSCEPEGIDLDLVGQMKEMTIGADEEEETRRGDGEEKIASKLSIFDKMVPSTKVSLFVLVSVYAFGL